MGLDFDKKSDGQLAVLKWRIANPKDIKAIARQARFFHSGNDTSSQMLFRKWFTEAEIGPDRMRAYCGQAFADTPIPTPCRLVRSIMLEQRISGATKLAKAGDSSIVSLQDLFTGGWGWSCHGERQWCLCWGW